MSPSYSMLWTWLPVEVRGCQAPEFLLPIWETQREPPTLALVWLSSVAVVCIVALKSSVILPFKQIGLIKEPGARPGTIASLP